MTHSCQHCKTEFERKRLNQFYCSQSCRQLAYVTRKYSGKQQESIQNNTVPGFDLAGLLGNMQPEILLQLLNSAVNNPSMTDKLTDKKEKPANTHDSKENPSQNVNDGFVKKSKNDRIFTQNAYEQKSAALENPSLGTLRPGDGSTFDLMLHHEFTISIPPKGYVRSLFPRWENKEWELSQYVNGKMVGIFDCLFRADVKNTISHRELYACHNQIKEFCEGPVAFCLPADYPFKQFMYYLSIRLEPLVKSAEGKKKIKFRIGKEIEEMMTIIRIQIGTESAF